jgi:hypothetical protein
MQSNPKIIIKRPTIIQTTPATPKKASKTKTGNPSKDFSIFNHL